MGEIYLLDCTLRDGGYVNNWNFGYDNILAIMDRLCEANVDIIEIGFLDDRQPFDINRTIQPCTGSYAKIFGKTKKKPMIVGMIDYGTCNLDNIEKCEDTMLDGIRLIFKKEKYPLALDYSIKLKEKGYLVFLQMVSITSYDKEDLKQFISRVNTIKPYAVSIVDTYGLLNKDKLLDYFEILDDGLDTSIIIGYHSHNNFQLGYANAIEFVQHESKHDKVVDGTLYGMGKSAGNGPIELIAMYLNDYHSKQYRIDSLLEAIDNNIMDIYRKTYWGYSFLYYIAALNDCHPNYVKQLLEKNSLSTKSVNELLKNIPQEKKLHYDSAYMERLYLDYQKKVIDDEEDINRLKQIIGLKELLLIGPGNNIVSQYKKIDDYIKKIDPFVVAINWIPQDWKTNLIYVGNAKRYNLSYKQLSQHIGKIMGLSTIDYTKEVPLDFIVNYDTVIEHSKNGDVEDDSLTTAINAFYRAGIKKISLAGFDGFKKKGELSYHNQKDILYDHIDGIYYNERIKNRINEFSKKITIVFITDSVYNEK